MTIELTTNMVDLLYLRSVRFKKRKTKLNMLKKSYFLIFLTHKENIKIWGNKLLITFLGIQKKKLY